MVVALSGTVRCLYIARDIYKKPNVQSAGRSWDSPTDGCTDGTRPRGRRKPKTNARTSRVPRGKVVRRLVFEEGVIRVADPPAELRRVHGPKDCARVPRRRGQGPDKMGVPLTLRYDK